MASSRDGTCLCTLAGISFTFDSTPALRASASRPARIHRGSRAFCRDTSQHSGLGAAWQAHGRAQAWSMSHLLFAASRCQAESAAAGWPAVTQRHTRIRGFRTVNAQPCPWARSYNRVLSACPSSDTAREPRRRRAVCSAARDPGLLHVPGPPKRPDGRFSAPWRRLQQTFPILRYEALLQRIVGTFLLLGLARLGHFLPLEGVHPFAGYYTPGKACCVPGSKDSRGQQSCCRAQEAGFSTNGPSQCAAACTPAQPQSWSSIALCTEADGRLCTVAHRLSEDVF